MRFKRVAARAAWAGALSFSSAMAAAADLTIKVESEQYGSGTHKISAVGNGPINDTVTFQRPGATFDPRCASDEVGATGESHSKVSLRITGKPLDDGLTMLNIHVVAKKAGGVYPRGVLAPGGGSISKVQCPSSVSLEFGAGAAVRPGESLVLFDGQDTSGHAQLKLIVDMSQ